MRMPGTMVATKRSLMETPAVEPKRMSGMLGGIMMPRQPGGGVHGGGELLGVAFLLHGRGS